MKDKFCVDHAHIAFFNSWKENPLKKFILWAVLSTGKRWQNCRDCGVYVMYHVAEEKASRTDGSNFCSSGISEGHIWPYFNARGQRRPSFSPSIHYYSWCRTVLLIMHDRGYQEGLWLSMQSLHFILITKYCCFIFQQVHFIYSFLLSLRNRYLFP